MGLFDKLFGKKDNKKDEDMSSKNQTSSSYGMFNPTSFNKIIDIKNEIKDKCHKIMGEDGSILEKYMDSLSVSDDRKIVYLDKLALDKDVIREFANYLKENTYDLPEAITIKERTAKIISDENPELTAIEVYIKLIEEKRQAGE